MIGEINMIIAAEQKDGSMNNDVISRQAAIDAFEKELSAKYNGREFAIGFVGAESILKDLPSAQPEIIRCSECTQYRRWIDTNISFCDLTESERTSDDFCSRAERRTDE